MLVYGLTIRIWCFILSEPDLSNTLGEHLSEAVNMDICRLLGSGLSPIQGCLLFWRSTIVIIIIIIIITTGLMARVLQFLPDA